MPAIFVILLALFAIGCGGLPAATPLQIITETDAEWTKTPDFPERVWNAVDSALAYWGATRETIAGWTISVTDNVPCWGGIMAAGSCTLAGEVRTIYIGTNFGPCIEVAPIDHEVGHAVLWEQTGDLDPNHTDPRWNNLGAGGECP